MGGSAFPDEEGKDYSWVMGLSLLVTGNPKLQELTVTSDSNSFDIYRYDDVIRFGIS